MGAVMSIFRVTGTFFRAMGKFYDLWLLGEAKQMGGKFLGRWLLWCIPLVQWYVKKGHFPLLRARDNGELPTPRMVVAFDDDK